MKNFVSMLTIVAWLAAAGLADENTIPRTIAVSGQGTAASPPDMATVQTGVTTVAASAKEALAANNRAMEQVIKVLTDRNIANKDIQTSGFSVYPEYRQQQNPRGGSTVNQITGYRVTNNVSVRVRNLPRLGEILDALVQSGSNTLSGVNFSIAEPSAIMNEARRDAMDDARGRAELYAKAAGVKVGKVISISEQTIQRPVPMMHARMAMAESSSVPIATGEQEVSASINVMYELID